MIRMSASVLALALSIGGANPALSQDDVRSTLQRIERLLQGMQQQRPARPIGDRSTGGTVIVVSPSTPAEPTVVYATSSMDCGGTRYEVSTGNNAGRCTTSFGAGGKAETVTCDDGQGNGASVSCTTGAIGCGNVGGSGSCKITTK